MLIPSITNLSLIHRCLLYAIASITGVVGSDILGKLLDHDNLDLSSDATRGFFSLFFYVGGGGGGGAFSCMKGNSRENLKFLMLLLL